MEQLIQMRCVACRAGEPQLTDTETTEMLAQVPNWHIDELAGVKRLEQTFLFDNFAHALAFTDRVGALAEGEDHHPTLITEWGSTKVVFWTHAIGGLHRNDFIMAAKTDAAYRDSEGRQA